MRPELARVAASLLALTFAGCAGSGGSGGGASSTAASPSSAAVITTVTPTAVTPTTARSVTTTPPASTTPPTPSITTAASSSTTAPTSISPSTSTTTPLDGRRFEVGRSVEGRPIEAIERGTAGGRAVLVIGVIHGDEPAGLAVVDQLEQAPIPAGVDLWVVPSMNPDGQAARRRTNAHLVDLNRNFPRRWAPLDRPGQPEYAGPAPASEPETRAIVALISLVRPELVIWYHQDLNRIAPASGHAGQVRREYAALTGLPVLPVTGGTYTGTASTWAQANVRDSVSFIVELGPTLTPEQADRHAAAVLTVATG